jgi:hypothetical protein
MFHLTKNTKQKHLLDDNSAMQNDDKGQNIE